MTIGEFLALYFLIGAVVSLIHWCFVDDQDMPLLVLTLMWGILLIGWFLVSMQETSGWVTRLVKKGKQNG
jgi:hypothetical protein